MQRYQKTVRVAAVISFVLVPIALFMAFVYAPEERTMGVVQRIFYVHVASAWNAFLLFGWVAFTSALYLWKRNPVWNEQAKAAAEVGVLFTTFTLVAGSLWARPIWNTWWTWDPRLTTTLVLWFIYVAYLLLQSGEVSERRERLAAIFGIVGVVNIPIVHMSAELWRSIHPVVVKQSGMGMPPQMAQTLFTFVAAFTAVGVLLVALRAQVGLGRMHLDRLRTLVRTETAHDVPDTGMANLNGRQVDGTRLKELKEAP